MANPTTSETEENVTKLIRELDFYKTAVEDLDRHLSKAHKEIKDLRTSYRHLVDDYIAVDLKLKDIESHQSIHQLKSHLNLARQQLIQVQNDNQQLNTQMKSRDVALQKAEYDRKVALEEAAWVDSYMSMNSELITQINNFLELKTLDVALDCSELSVDRAMTELDVDECKDVIQEWFEEPAF